MNMTSKAPMHPVESLTRLYRARRYWHTPELDQAFEKIINHFGDRESIPPEFMTQFIGGIMRNGVPNGDGWHTFYEPCPVVKITAMEIIVVSKDMPSELLEAYSVFSKGKPKLYDGGRFNINKPKLQRDGKAYHSRHGEYFYIDVPESAIALVESRELLEVVA